jgi:hypothetical protein
MFLLPGLVCKLASGNLPSPMQRRSLTYFAGNRERPLFLQPPAAAKPVRTQESVSL